MSPAGLSPQEFNQYADQALALQQAGNLDAAQAMYETLLLADPKNSGLMVNLAGVHSTRGNLEEAVALLQRSLALNPKEPYAHLAYGHAQTRLANLDKALAAYDTAITLQPNVALFHVGRGNTLASLKRQAEALTSYEHASALEPEQAIYWLNRGAILHHLKREDDALTCYDKAISLQLNYVDAYINRGTLLGNMRRFEEALKSFDRAIALDANASEAYWNKSLVLLTLGDFEAGWALFESRWHKPVFRKELRDYPQPLWLGDGDIRGKTILIHPEQGFGDYLQLARYALVLEAMGAHVVLEAQAALVPLLKTLSSTITVLATGAPLPVFHLHCPLMSLPLALKTTIDTIPYAQGYLTAEAAKVAIWEAKLGPKTKPRIGIAWSGSTTHVNDHNRSMPLAALGPLFDLPFEFHSLQKETREADRPFMTTLIDHSEELQDFTDTAALVQTMDLVISVDTAITHLAGALAKPTLLLVAYVPDFRWLLDREDSPWYTTLRLFRQPKPDDWASVVTQVKDVLMENPAPADGEVTIEQAFQMALEAHQAGDLEGAGQLYAMIIDADPNHLNSIANLSSLELTRGNLEAALMLIEQALSLDPNQAALHYNYGKILMQVRMAEEALKRYNRAIELQPDNAQFYSNRGVALYELTRYAEAIESYSRAIVLDAKVEEFYNNRGNALGHLGRFVEAIADYSKAISLKPDMADAYWNRGLLQLMHGDFDAGLQGYEWRWKRANFKGDLREYSQPLWLGDVPLDGKTILIYPEQGLGDSIQFARYVPMLEAIGAKVILEVPASLVALMSSISPTATVIAKGTTPPAFDYQCPIMSLPLAFKLTAETIPGNVPYLSVSDAKRAEWATKLGPKTKPRIGLVWSGSATHVNDHNRSVSLATLAPLFALPMEFHSLQKEVRDADAPYVKQMVDHATALRDFTDTAALIETMDLVISVDTSVAHVAGALGKKLWLLLPSIPDYRWLLNRDDTPWYPQATLFRQQIVGDWATIITRLETELKKLA